MSLRHRAMLFLLRPPPETAPTRAGHLRQALVGPRAEEIAAILSPVCRRVGGRAVLLGTDGRGRIRVGTLSAHPHLALAHEPLAPLLQALLGPQGMLLLGRFAEISRPQAALAWEMPVRGHLIGNVAHALVLEWRDETSRLGIFPHAAILIP